VKTVRDIVLEYQQAYGFEIKKDFFKGATKMIREYSQPGIFCEYRKRQKFAKQEEVL